MVGRGFMAIMSHLRICKIVNIPVARAGFERGNRHSVTYGLRICKIFNIPEARAGVGEGLLSIRM